MSDLREQGIAAAKAGRRDEARNLLARALQRDTHDEHAWLWLAGVLDETADIRRCLHRVLALNPSSVPARQGLNWLDSRSTTTDGAATNDQAVLQTNDGAATDDQRPHTNNPATVNAAAMTISPSQDSREIPASSDHVPSRFPELPARSHDVALLRPCPYCGAPTFTTRERCPKCGKSLMLRGAVRTMRLAWLIALVALVSLAAIVLAHQAWPTVPVLALSLLVGVVATLIGLAVFRYGDFFGPSQRLAPQIDPSDDANAHYTKGLDYQRKGMWHTAAQAWEAAIAQAPGDIPSLHALGLAYAQLKRFDEARTTLDQAIALAPDDRRLRESRALVDTMVERPKTKN